MEYRYALETEKPIIAFFHRKPEDIKALYTEKSEDGKRKLEQENEELIRQLSLSKITAPVGTETLSQGENAVAITLSCIVHAPEKSTLTEDITTTWNRLLQKLHLI